MNEVEKWASKIEKGLVNFVRQVRIDTVTHIRLATPVDTNQARSNWQLGDTISQGPLWDATEINKEDLKKANTVPFYKNFYIINNLPYIIALERGWSAQAPQGMVKLTVELMQAEINNKKL